MYEANDLVKVKETGQVLRVVAEVSNSKDYVVVWEDKYCTKTLVLFSDSVEATEQAETTEDTEKFIHINYTAIESKDGDMFQVGRRAVGVGSDAMVAVYADMRALVEKTLEMPIMEVDALIDEVQEN